MTWNIELHFGVDIDIETEGCLENSNQNGERIQSLNCGENGGFLA